MIYITGDKHADFYEVCCFCKKEKTNISDLMIILGDAGINYFNDPRDYKLKKELSDCNITFFCVHGNHEERPEKIKTYKTKDFHDGIVYYEEEYPNILFAKDGEIYNLNNKSVLVIGGAYSVDKEYRIKYGYCWYETEQPDDDIKKRVFEVIKNNNDIDIVLSHTCPYKYMPREVFMAGVDQSKVDYSTEKFLDELEKNIKNKKYFDNYSYMEYTGEKLKEYLNNLSNLEILDKIKEMQNNSSNHQAEANHLVISLANLIFTEKESKDPFWINSSKQLFIGLAGVFLEDYKKGLIDENKINIASIKKFQNSSLIKENQMYLQRNLNTRSYGNLSKDYLTSILSSAENTYKSVTAVFGEKMSIFDDLNVENVTSISEFNFTDVGRKPTALYIIVPDEDKSYYQLVTIILGMLIKDLSKFANMPENNGMLPVKVEWILEEFANMPPINDIHVSVSVARSRGMRYIFFIQSFAQLDQIYGKEIASIIIDNSALCYLKTNSVECAQIIEKKLGKATITTNSLSTSTDPFKVGGNQTTSLLGRELLTANEIISLKYKTIIFPVFGNPIFRDTYMYSDLYPKYKKVAICEREIKVLKRLTDNYYTVEKLREYYDKESNNKEKVITRKIITSSQRQTKNKMRRIIKNVNGENNVVSLLNNLKDWFTNRIISEMKDDDNVYTLEIVTLLNKMDLIRLKKLFTNDITVEIASNKKIRKTIISFWNNLEGEKYL